MNKPPNRSAPKKRLLQLVFCLALLSLVYCCTTYCSLFINGGKDLLLLLVIVLLALAIPSLLGQFTRLRDNQLITELQTLLKQLAKGEALESPTLEKDLKFADINKQLNKLIDHYQDTVNFTNKIANGTLDVQIKKRSKEDVLSCALNTMAENLLAARESLEKQVYDKSVQLAESKKRFQSLVSHIPGVVYRCELDGVLTVQFISDKITTLTGRKNTYFTNRKVKYLEIIHKDHRNKVEKELAHTLKTGKPYQLEYQIQSTSGETHWVYETAEFYYDKDGTPRWLDGVIFNITGRKIAEQTLKNHQDHLQELIQERTRALEKSNADLLREQAFIEGILENIEDGIVACDTNGHISFFNQATLKFHGIESEEVVPENWMEQCRFYLSDGITPMPPEKEPLNRVKEDEVIHHEELVIAPAQGKKRSLRTSGRIIKDPDGKKLGAVISMHDISTIKEVDQERARNEQRLQLLYNLNRKIYDLEEHALIENGLDIVLHLTGCEIGYLHFLDDDLDVEKKTIFRSKTTGESLLQYNPDYPTLLSFQKDSIQIQKTSVSNYLILDDKDFDFPGIGGHLQRHMCTHAMENDHDFFMVGVLGRTEPFSELDALQLEILTNEILKLVLRKRAEEAVKDARDEAEKANLAKSIFLAKMSHEIRTPLNAIIGIGEILLDTPLTTEQQKFVEIFVKNGENLLGIINDIIDLTKIEADKLTLENVEFNLLNLLEETCSLLALRCHEKGLSLHNDFAGDVPISLMGDPVRLRQILINLIGNAIKFTSSGDITVTCKVITTDGSEQRSALNTLSPQPETPPQVELLLSVTDTGIGLSPDKAEKIFEQFEQEDASTTREYGGTGLGLTICKQLVEKMKGSIWVESKVGEGSTFSFSIKLKAVEEFHSIKSFFHCEEKPKVLQINNNPISLRLFSKTLTDWGVSIDSAPDGTTGIGLLKHAAKEQKEYDLVLIDYHAPDPEGLDLAKRIHAYPTFSPQIVMMLQTNEKRSNIKHYQNIGITNYLLKPLRRTELFSALQFAVGKTYKLAHHQIPNTSFFDISTLPPQRILLAEDYNHNQLIIQLYLRDTPFQLEMADNGAMTVQMYKDNSYDLVLMDMQMPIMDGYSATAKIREYEEQTGKKPVPIIALTAAAMLEEKEKCLGAGCDEHLGKPIKKETLLTTLVRFLSENDNRSPALYTKTQATRSQAAQDRRPDIIEVEIDQDFKDLLPDYLEDVHREIKIMETALQDKDFETLLLISHRLKGSGGGYGLGEISTIAHNIGHSANHQNSRQIEEELGNLENYLQRLKITYV